MYIELVSVYREIPRLHLQCKTLVVLTAYIYSDGTEIDFGDILYDIEYINYT